MKKRFKIFLCISFLFVSIFLLKITSYANEEENVNSNSNIYTFNYVFIYNWDNLAPGEYKIYGNPNAFLSCGFYFDEILFIKSGTISNIVYRDTYVGNEIVVADIIETGNDGYPGIHFIDLNYMYIQNVNGFSDIQQQVAFETAYLPGIRSVMHEMGVNTPYNSINGYYAFNFTNIDYLINSSIYGNFIFNGKTVNNLIIYDEYEPRIRLYYDNGGYDTFIVSDFIQYNFSLLISGSNFTTLSINAFPNNFFIPYEPPSVNNWDNFFISLINVPLLYLQSLLNVEIFGVNVFYGIGSVVIILILCKLIKRLL